MIPRTIHYVWLGEKEIPDNLCKYMETWTAQMPTWQVMGWNEKTIPAEVLAFPYVQQALEAKKYAFASDYIRLWALEQYGGVYMDTDVEVIRSFNELPEFNLQSSIFNLQSIKAFIGFEESLAHLPGTCVMGCEAHCQWVKDMLSIYDDLRFKIDDCRFDLTTNVQRMGKAMIDKYGLVPNGKEQFLPLTCSEASSNLSPKIHVYDHHHFSPITSTRVMRRTKDTFAIHHFASSWREQKGWMNKLKASPIVCEMINALVQIKRIIKRQK